MTTNTNNDTHDRLMEIGKNAFASIAELVAALECDYDRLEELRDERADLQSELESAADNSDERDNAIAALEAFDRENGEELAELIAAAGDCEDRDDAERRIQDDALSVEVRGDWHELGDDSADAPTEFKILITTGGPAVQIMGELDEYREPVRAWLQVQDWGTPWTDYTNADRDTLLTYAGCFYFGS